MIGTENSYRQIVEGLPGALYICDAAGRILYFNDAAAVIWGRQPELGKDLWCGSWRIYYPDGQPVSLDSCPMAVALKEGRPVNGVEVVVERPDGVRCNVMPYPKPIFDDSGAVIGAFNMLVDITDLKRADEAIRESEERFRQLANLVPQIVWTADAGGFIDYYNKQWYEYTGYEENTGNGSWLSILHPDDTQVCYDKWYDSVSSGELFQIEYRFKDRLKSEAYRWFLGRALPVRDNTNKIVKWFGTCTDIHDQKMNNVRNDEFIGIASHELRTPLTSLKGYLQLLERSLKNHTDEKPQLYVKKTNTYIGKLNDLVGDLLDVSKIQSGKLKLNISEFDFDEFINECAADIKYTESSHQIIIRGKAGVKITADKHRLEQVFTNYISNAIKYSPGANEIVVMVSSDTKNVRVAVTDSGLGIPQQQIQHLFERFHRVEDPVNSFDGLGLGLYISSEIINQHKGKVWVKSELGAGSTFYFQIPVHNS